MTLVYSEDFSAPGSQNNWIEVRNANPGSNSPLSRVTGDGDPYVKAVSTEADPWWWDPNHYYPGTGYVNLLAVAYATPSGPLPQVNYANGKVILECRVKDFILPRQARMVWWFQFDSGSEVKYNYAQIANPLDDHLGFGSRGWGQRPVVRAVKDSGWRQIEIPFQADNRSWLCYGSNPNRDGVPPLGTAADPVIYGCAPGGIEEAFDMPLLDMGIHLLWQNTLAGNPRGSAPPETRAYGEMHVRKVGLYAGGGS